MLRVVAIAALLGILINVAGVPYLRTEYTYQRIGSSKAILSATYWMPLDEFAATPASLGRRTCPLIVLRPIEMSLQEQVVALWRLVD